MKTLIEVKTEIAALQEIGIGLKAVSYGDKAKERKRKRELKAAQTRASFLKSMALYLENDPKSEFIRQEINRLTGRKNAIIQCIPSDLMHTDYNPVLIKERKKWEKEQGIEKINAQLKTLKYILS